MLLWKLILSIDRIRCQTRNDFEIDEKGTMKTPNNFAGSVWLSLVMGINENVDYFLRNLTPSWPQFNIYTSKQNTFCSVPVDMVHLTVIMEPSNRYFQVYATAVYRSKIKSAFAFFYEKSKSKQNSVSKSRNFKKSKNYKVKGNILRKNKT